MRLLKQFGVGLVVVAAVAMTPARADALTFQLNCVIEGGSVCSDSSSLGTLTLTAAGGVINGVLDYSGSGELKDSVWLNFDPALDNSGWTVTGAKLDSFLADENNLKADGYSGDFDLRILFLNNTFEPYNFTISKTGTALTEAMFNFRDDDNNQLFAAAHIQSGVDAQGNDCSIWMGSKGQATPTGPVPPCGPGGGGGGTGQVVPEPASLALFGLAALGAAARARRRNGK
jgi:hypothetical protein